MQISLDVARATKYFSTQVCACMALDLLLAGNLEPTHGSFQGGDVPATMKSSVTRWPQLKPIVDSASLLVLSRGQLILMDVVSERSEVITGDVTLVKRTRVPRARSAAGTWARRGRGTAGAYPTGCLKYGFVYGRTEGGLQPSAV
jgi:hypothetical protein